GGICWNTWQFLLPPLLLTAFYGFHHYLATPPSGHPELSGSFNFEAFLCIAGAELVMLAFAIVLGVHVALRIGSSRLAISQALGTVFFLSVGTLVCIYLILINPRFGAQWTSFIFFLAA